MISKISSGIVRILLKNNIIEADDTEIYQYGFEMILSTAVMLLIVLVCGLIFGEMISSIVFFIMFALIRSSCGGYHADTHLKCNIIYAINLVSVLFWVKFATPYYTISGHIMFIVIYLLMACQFSPVKNPNKPLDNLQKKKHKTLCIIYGLFLSAVSFVLWFGFNKIKFAVLIAAILISVTIAMAVEIFQKGEKKDEKDCS